MDVRRSSAVICNKRSRAGKSPGALKILCSGSWSAEICATPQSGAWGKQLPCCGGRPPLSVVQVPALPKDGSWGQEHLDIGYYRARVLQRSWDQAPFLYCLTAMRRRCFCQCSHQSSFFSLWCHLSAMTTFNWPHQMQSVALYMGWVTCPAKSVRVAIFHGCLCALPSSVWFSLWVQLDTEMFSPLLW